MTQPTSRAVLLRAALFGGILFAGVSPIVSAPPALGDDVLFAAPPPSGAGLSSETYLTSLGDIMANVQWRHIKLWHAIRSKNWELLNYELSQLKDSFDKAAVLYRNLPVEYIGSVVKPLLALQEAVKANDLGKVKRGFTDLTTACNSCHQAAGIGFIAIQTPTSSPFSDQKFAPAQK
ncbi:hypothetical protein [Methylocapsa aurea]|uniref:hypothetical protein n=1 Tax=Methylocapsa aurea TaxID=663610 RepID=UPI00068A8CDE|nr:hypothetical protein [Methylocapsa aurea]